MKRRRVSERARASSTGVRLRLGAVGDWLRTVAGQIFNNSTGSTTAGLPPDLSLALSPGIISGKPTHGGTTLFTDSTVGNPLRFSRYGVLL